MRKQEKVALGATVGVVTAGLIGFILFLSWNVIPAGSAGVTTWWGEVYGKSLPAGAHFVNPFAGITEFSIRDFSVKESMTLPSQDQLQSTVDISFQVRADPTKLGHIHAQVGTIEQVVDVHLIPNARQKARELSKTVAKAEDFFEGQTVVQLQAGLDEYLIPLMAEHGLILSGCLVRNIDLPEAVHAGVKKKKLRDQQVEEQRAEQERFKIEQAQLVIGAEAKKAAAEVEAETVKLLADARAYEIQQISAATANYVYLRLIDTTQSAFREFLEAAFPNYRRQD